jgi:hypothetical protein
VRPLKTIVGGYSHIFVAIDKFTKWIEVKPVTATAAAKVAEFIEEISHWFGVPNRIITDLGTSSWVLSSGTTAKGAASTSTTPPWRTPGATAKSKGPMA